MAITGKYYSKIILDNIFTIEEAIDILEAEGLNAYLSNEFPGLVVSWQGHFITRIELLQYEVIFMGYISPGINELSCSTLTNAIECALTYYNEVREEYGFE